VGYVQLHGISEIGAYGSFDQEPFIEYWQVSNNDSLLYVRALINVAGLTGLPSDIALRI